MTSPPTVATAGVRLVPNFAGFGGALRFGLSGILRAESLLGAAAISGLGASIATVTAFATRSFYEVEQSLAKIVGLVGVAEDRVYSWGEALGGIASATAQDPGDLADALFYIASAGIRSNEALEVLEQSAKAATAGLGDAKVVADAVTSAMNAYGEENLSAAEATDVLVATVREGKVEADSLAPVLGRVIPLAAELGIEFDQVGASLAAMTRLGLGAAEAATALRGIMTVLIRPSAQASKILAEYGLSAKGLRDTLKSNEGDLLDVLLMLRDRFEGNGEALSRVFPRVRALTGVLNLVGENADQARGIFDLLAESTGALDEAFGAIESTEGFAFQQALADVKVSMMEIGRDIMPELADMLRQFAPIFTETIIPAIAGAIEWLFSFIEGVKQLWQAFQNLDPAIHNVVVGIGAFVGAFLLVKFNPILTGLSLIAVAIAGIGHEAREQAAEVQEFLDLMKAGADPEEVLFNKIVNSENLRDIRDAMDYMDISMGTLIETILREGPNAESVLDSMLDPVALYMAAGGSDALQRRIEAAIDLLGEYGEEITIAQDMLADWAYEQKLAAGDAVSHSEALEANLVAANDLDPAIRGLSDSTRDYTSAQQTDLDTTYDRTEAIKEMKDMIIEAAEAQLEAADPAFRLFKEQQRLNDAQAEYTATLADSKASENDKKKALLDVLEAQLRVQAAQGEFDANLVTAIDAIRGAAEALGLELSPELQQIIQDLLGISQALDSTDLESLGLELKGGILRGVGGLEDELTASMISAILAAMARTRARFVMLSPSRVMAEKIGQPLAEGIVAGFDAVKLSFDSLDGVIADFDRRQTTRQEAGAPAGTAPNYNITVVNPYTSDAESDVQRALNIGRTVDSLLAGRRLPQ